MQVKQPWMSNHRIKVRILLCETAFHNPEMEAYRKEFNALALVPQPNDFPKLRESRPLRDAYADNR